MFIVWLNCVDLCCGGIDIVLFVFYVYKIVVKFFCDCFGGVGVEEWVEYYVVGFG